MTSKERMIAIGTRFMLLACLWLIWRQPVTFYSALIGSLAAAAFWHLISEEKRA